MADDAFALSPISARAARPTDADYDAICEAFMETARGRWFLTEYARRNRNADTRAVLDAVGRLEELVAAGKSEAKPAETPQDDPRLAEAQARVEVLMQALHACDADLAGAQAALARMQDTQARDATPALPEASLDAIRHAGQMVQGVAWTLRESGADGRVCTLLDMQAKAIAAGHASLVRSTAPAEAANAENAVSGVSEAERVLSALRARIAALIGGEPERAPDVPEPAASSEIFELDDTPVAMPLAAADAARPTAPHVRATPPAPQIIEPAELEWSQYDAAPLTLGDVLTGEGIAPAPKPTVSDPFAPFARMSRAERRAFFS